MFGDELVEVLLEELVFAQAGEGRVVKRDQGVDMFERAAQRVIAERLVEGLEIEKRKSTQRSRRLVNSFDDGLIAF